MERINISSSVFYSFRLFSCFFVDFDYFLVNFGAFQRFWKKARNPRWPPLNNMTHLLRNKSLPAHVAERNLGVLSGL